MASVISQTRMRSFSKRTSVPIRWEGLLLMPYPFDCYRGQTRSDVPTVGGECTSMRPASAVHSPDGVTRRSSIGEWEARRAERHPCACFMGLATLGEPERCRIEQDDRLMLRLAVVISLLRPPASSAGPLCPNRASADVDRHALNLPEKRRTRGYRQRNRGDCLMSGGTSATTVSRFRLLPPAYVPCGRSCAPCGPTRPLPRLSRRERHCPFGRQPT
jgi:hypothetical protein